MTSRMIGMILAQEHVWRFAGHDAPGYLEGTHDAWLAGLSVLVAVMGSYGGISVVGRMQQISQPMARRVWHLAGGASLGLAVWAMHFTGMLAFILPVPVSFAVDVTILSVIPAFVAGLAFIAVLGHPSLSIRQVTFGGVTLALGVASMHYIGMEAMVVDATMTYDPTFFIVSVVVAFVLASVAIGARLVACERVKSTIIADLVSAVLVGLAVSGMHYTAMRSARFFPLPTGGVLTVEEDLQRGLLAMVIAAAIALILVLILGSVELDRRLGSAEATAKRSESRNRVLLEAMPDGFITIKPDATIESMNPAAEALFGYEHGLLLGRAVDRILPWLGLTSEAQLIDLSESGRSYDFVGLRVDGSTVPLSVRFAQARIESQQLTSLVVRDVTELRAADQEIRRLATAVDQVHEAILVLTDEGQVEYVNAAFIAMTGFDPESLRGRLPDLLDPEAGEPERCEEIWRTIRAGEVWKGESLNKRADDTQYWAESTLSAIRGKQGEVTSFVEVRRDLTARHALEQQLASAQKLESIGHLAAGIAHEINTPTQYVGDNTRFLRDSFGDLLTLANSVRDHVGLVKAGTPAPDAWDEIAAVVEASDVDYLLDEIPRAIDQSLEGIARVAGIVRAMKEFSHPSVDKTPTDLNAAIQSTATVATNEWKYVAELEMELAPDLPAVEVVPGEFNQVVLNLIVNAAHAIGDAQEEGSEEKGTITLGTREENGGVTVTITDTGCGMSPEIAERIFDPFYTTKEVGRGTGQGLSIAHNVVVQKHGGSIQVASAPGEGTTFTIWLPVTAEDVDDRPNGPGAGA